MQTAGPPQGAKAPLGAGESRAGKARGAPGAAARVKVQRRPVHGVLLLDKPLGLSSNDALQKAKWLLRAEKAGHTGTLDPMATGVLPLCFGAATKFSQLHLEADKTYVATARLGVRTATGDAEGEVVETRGVAAIAPAVLEAVQARFTGLIRQTPPMNSALKKDGRALYEYARAGVQVVRAVREVNIRVLRLELLAPDLLKITAAVSKGTYIRTLGEDIGEALGCGAHLASLRRVATGPFDLSGCVTLAALEAMEPAQREACLLPIGSMLADHTRVMLGAEDAARFLTGLRRRGPWADQPHVAVFGPEPVRPEFVEGHAQASAGAARTVLLGTAHVKAGELIPGRLLSPIEIQQILASREQAAIL